MNCPKCNSIINQGENFCKICGYIFNQNQQPQQSNYNQVSTWNTNMNTLQNNTYKNQKTSIDVINNNKKVKFIPILIIILLIIILSIIFKPKLLSKEENKTCTSTGKKVGDIVTCGEESFYIINKTSSKITMISKYTINLTSHKQNELVDTIAFSEEKYWHNNGMKEHYSNSYPTYVYDENSNLYSHVQTYQNYLINNIGVKSAQASIISIEQLEELGCVKSNQVYKCSNAPSWVYSISYWTGEANSYRTIFSINPAGVVSTDTFNHGIRPVITISENEVSYKNKTFQSSKGCVGTGIDIGSLITCGKEKFYVIESDTETITMLTENRVDLKKHQQSTNAGDISFSNTNYWDNGSLNSKYGNNYPAYVYDDNSNLYTHVQAYQKYLIDKIGIKSASASLISVEQLEKLGCEPDKLSCKNAPAWVYSTSYWTGTAIRSNVLSHVFSQLLSTNDYSQSRGLRPIVNIKKEEIRFE